MAPDSLQTTAGRLATALGESALLVGGLAVMAWGHVRATEHVDFICRLEPDEIRRRLVNLGTACEIRRRDLAAGDIPWVVRGELDDVKFDVLPAIIPIDRASAVEIELGEVSPLMVVGLVDLIRLKLRAGGPKGLWDVAVLLRIHPDQESAARREAGRLGIAEELDRWLADPRIVAPPS